MLITDHPFYVLGINSRSGKREILQRAEDLASRSPSEDLMHCRSQVTHPAKRLSVEASWFPGLAPSKIRQIVGLINEDAELPLRFDEKLRNIDPLARFNALAFWIGEHDHISAPLWTLALHNLNRCAKAIDPSEVAELLNADRSVAGFPAIPDNLSVEKTIASHTENIAAFLADKLTQCASHAQVVTSIVQHDTANGESQASDFINRFVDRYQIQVQPILDGRRGAIDALCDELLSAIRAEDGAKIDRAIGGIEQALSDWDCVAQPIQLLMKARGLRDSHSVEVGKKVRKAVIRLANEFDRHDEARRITDHLQQVFAEVPEIAELLLVDSDDLDDIITARDQQRLRELEFQKEIELDMLIGSDRLQINHEFIAYRGGRLPLLAVKRLRWGIFKSYTNGIRTRREFTIWIGSEDFRYDIVIECVRFMESEEKVFQRYCTILDKLWKAVGSRLLLQIASQIMSGGAVSFGGVTVVKGGIFLTKRKWFSSEPYFAPWEELSKVAARGELCLSSSREPKASASLSFRDVDNAVILDRLLDMLWKDGNYRKFRAGTLFQDDADDGEQ